MRIHTPQKGLKIWFSKWWNSWLFLLVFVLFFFWIPILSSRLSSVYITMLDPIGIDILKLLDKPYRMKFYRVLNHSPLQEMLYSLFKISFKIIKSFRILVILRLWLKEEYEQKIGESWVIFILSAIFSILVCSNVIDCS